MSRKVVNQPEMEVHQDIPVPRHYIATCAALWYLKEVLRRPANSDNANIKDSVAMLDVRDLNMQMDNLRFQLVLPLR